MEDKLKVEMVDPLKTSQDQNRRQKLFLIRIKWKKIYGEVQTAGFEVYHDPKMGKGLWGDFHSCHGKKRFRKGGEDHSKCHKAILKDFSKEISQVKSIWF